MKYKLSHPELLEVRDGATVYFGGSQEWYSDAWKKRAGCGPVSASLIMWYLARSRAGLSGLCDAENRNIGGFLRLMEDMFGFVTPGMKGVNTSKIFTEGALRYAASKLAPLAADILEIDKIFRPPHKKVRDFIQKSLLADCPVAFLNLSNGKVKNLDNWHWVTIVEFGYETGMATACDQGRKIDIDIIRWLRTSLLGGAFVTLREAD